ncbi:lipid-A-disaccharide synthase [Arenicella sp. 4NH20-0111]|uniref:lipid-A-disaccharide synthase n=1 Tax=Arenicella sp. 4NH20-0111 TaxID=3127648 RepID=UPI003101EFCE
MKVGIVAGEKSGDFLGAELVEAIKKRHPNAEFVGLGGDLMQSAGVVSLADMEKISIMGIAGALKGLREILSIRRKIRQHMMEWKPDVFVGIDVPDFNLGLEIKLKEHGIPVVHYVSPTVWAWRSKRIFKIKRAIDLMLTLFPFEEEFYQKNNTPVRYVGHPLAKQVIDWEVSSEFLSALNVERSESKKIIALLPGSRMSEVSRLAPVMFEAAVKLKQTYPDLEFVVPAANEKLAKYLREVINEYQAPVRLIEGHSRDLLAVCYATILASGTAALEAALFAKPMVVMYKVAKFEEWYASRTMVVEHFSMPNHLVKPPVVPELIQKEATPERVIYELRQLLDLPEAYEKQRKSLASIVTDLSEDSGELACDAIEALLLARKS